MKYPQNQELKPQAQTFRLGKFKFSEDNYLVRPISYARAEYDHFLDDISISSSLPLDFLHISATLSLTRKLTTGRCYSR